MRKVRNIFEPKASRVIRCLLSNPGKAWSTRMLARESKVSLGYTHAVIASLLDLDYIIRNDSNLIETVDPIKLLERWASYYQYTHENMFFEFYTFENDLKKSVDRLRGQLVDYALTSLSGAYESSPYVRPTTLEVYVRDKQHVEEISEVLNAKPTEGRGNIRLVIPYDEGVFYGVRDIHGVKVVSDIQLYVDLKNYPGRGEEAAQAILKTVKNKWAAVLLGDESVREEHDRAITRGSTRTVDGS